jgi:hypothetical protein
MPLKEYNSSTSMNNMESDSMQGFGKLLLIWAIGLILFFTALAVWFTPPI